MSQLLNKMLNIVFVNINGCNSNLNPFMTSLYASNIIFDILVLIETKLSNESQHLYDIPNFNHTSLYRNNYGGGIRVYYKQTINITVIEKYTQLFETHESLFVKIMPNKVEKFIIGCIYRPPNKSVHDFNTFLEEELFCDQMILESKCLLIGDFNINIDSSANVSYQTQNFCNIMESNDYNQCVHDLTRIDYNTRLPTTLLDHAWVNFYNVQSAEVLDFPPSDHLPIMVTLKLKEDTNIFSIKTRNYSQHNILLFTQQLDQIFNSYSINHTDSIDDEFERLENFLISIVNRFFPFTTKQMSLKRLSMPWLNPILINLINKKHKLFIALKKGYVNYNYFKAYTEILKLVLVNAKRNYFTHEFEKYNKSSKKTWETINKLYGKDKKSQPRLLTLDNGEEITDEEQIATLFNQYFANVASQAQANIDQPHQSYDHLIEFNNRSIFLAPTTPYEIESLIKGLSTKKNAQDPSSRFLKLCSAYISVILSDLFDLCLEQGVYPKRLKYARITPVFKSGKRQLISNYRPISVLSSINKIFEKLLFKRFSEFFELCGTISDNQFGFVKSRDTQQAALHLITSILPVYETNECAAVLFLDFSRAFDTIDRDRLLFKAYRHGIRGLAYDILKSYLSDRYHYTCINLKKSSLLINQIGVPQGSCMGPLLFILYINDLINLINNALTILFADDTTVAIKNKNMRVLQARLNFAAYKINDWCKHNKLILNAKKTKVMYFNAKNNEIPVVKIDNNIIETVQQYKYLGFLLDNRLRHSFHVSKVIAKLKSLKYVSKKISSYMTISSAKAFYYSLVFSHLKYGILVWGGTMDTLGFRTLELLQNKIILNLFGKNLNTQNKQTIYKNMKILKLSDIYKTSACMAIYNCLQNNYLPSLRNTIIGLIRNHPHLTRNRRNFRLPMPRLMAIKLNIVYQALKCWNTTDPDIRNSQSPKEFKRKLIEPIFNGY